MKLIEIPHFIPAKIPEVMQFRIPRKIYQTWKTRFVSESIASNIYNIINNNPNYDYYFFGDDDCKKFLEENYTPEYLQAFNDLNVGAFKADFWRYAILYKQGGVYIDVDLNVLHKIDSIIGIDYDFVSIWDKNPSKNKIKPVYQAFIATTPNYPYLLQTLNTVLHNIQTRYYGEELLGITGPVAMGNVIYNINGIDKNRIKFYTFQINGDNIIDDSNNIIFKHKIEGYNANDNYGKKFRRKIVYIDDIDYIKIVQNILIIIILLFIIKLLYKKLKK